MTWQNDFRDTNGSPVDAYSVGTGQDVRSAWDILYLGLITAPGVATVEPQIDTGLDVQKAKGTKGSFVGDDGRQPIKISVTLTIVPSEWLEWVNFSQQLLLPPNATDGAPIVLISHPSLEPYGIGHVKCSRIRPSHPNPDGTMTIRFDLVEYIPKPKQAKQGVPRGAGTGNAPLKVPLGTAAQENEDLQNSAVDNLAIL